MRVVVFHEKPDTCSGLFAAPHGTFQQQKTAAAFTKATSQLLAQIQALELYDLLARGTPSSNNNHVN